jgi:hypothetical protein
VSPILAGVLAGVVHLAVTLAVIVGGMGPTFRRRETGLPATFYDRSVIVVLRAVSFPMIHLTERFPRLLNETGWPREHLLLLANSALWGIIAGVLVRMI